MKKLLQILILCLFVISPSYGSDFFKYKLIIGCGPKISTFDEIKSYEHYKYHFTHLSDTEAVIFNDYFEYASYKKTTYSHLWMYNHRTTSLEFEKDEETNTFQFKMISEFHDKSYSSDHEKTINFLNINTESMTFSERRVGYPKEQKYLPSTGVCWLIK